MISTIPGILYIFRKPRSIPWLWLKCVLNKDGRWRERSPKNMPRNRKMFWQNDILKGGKVIQECLDNVITKPHQHVLVVCFTIGYQKMRFPNCACITIEVMKKLWKVLNKSNRSKISPLQFQCIKAGFSSIENRIIFGQNTFSDEFLLVQGSKINKAPYEFPKQGFCEQSDVDVGVKNKPRIVIHLTPNMLYHRALVERLYELDRAIKDFAFQDLLDSKNKLSTQNLCLSLPWCYNRLSERKHAKVRGNGL